MKVIDLHKALGGLIEQGKGDHIAVAYSEFDGLAEINTFGFALSSQEDRSVLSVDPEAYYRECEACVVLGG